jgi:release factor glutamine methyltransferase
VAATFQFPEERTILGVLAHARRFLKNNNVVNADWHAELLVGGSLGLKRHELYLNRDRAIEAQMVYQIAGALERRVRGEPTQYILGETEFYGLPFKCDARALIPRPETELLVDLALRAAPDRGDAPHLLDLGTGSGCIAVALAANLPGAQLVATDLSEEALALACENAEANGVQERIEFRTSDLFAAVPEVFDLIAANLPYVSTEAAKSLMREVREFEPTGALLAGPDGLSVLRRAVAEAPLHLKPGGSLLLEVGYDQAEAVLELLRATNAYREIRAHADYQEHLRVVTAQNAN